MIKFLSFRLFCKLDFFLPVCKMVPIQITLQFAAFNRPVYIHDKLSVLRNRLEDLQHSLLPGIIGFLPLAQFRSLP